MPLKPPATVQKLGCRGFGRDKLTRTAGNTTAFQVNKAGKPSLQNIPSITGIVKEGQTLSCTAGSWQGSTPRDVLGVWQFASSASSTDWTDIPPPLGTAQELVLPNDSSGLYLRVKLVCSNSLGSTTGYTSVVGPVIDTP